MTEPTAAVLDRFRSEVERVVPVVALWAHGSLAAGDYQAGRSDMDLVAVTAGTADLPGPRLRDLHRQLARQLPLARHLHCAYAPESRLADPSARHLTWAEGRFVDRPLSAVTRRELHAGGLVLAGPAPADLLAPVSDAELVEFLKADLTGFWLPATGHPIRWLWDIWVDLGPLTVARATVTLRDGRLITKREALAVLAELDAPAALVEDITRRRYRLPAGSAPRFPPVRRIRRARLARTFTRAQILRAVGQH